MRYGPIYHDCVRIQKRLMNLMMGDETTAKDVASLSAAWDRMEDRKRILKGRGVPRPEEPAKPKAKRHEGTFVE